MIISPINTGMLFKILETNVLLLKSYFAQISITERI